MKGSLNQSVGFMRGPSNPLRDSRHSLHQKVSIRVCNAINVLKDLKECLEDVMPFITDLSLKIAWVHGCMDAWMDGCMHGWMDALMDGWMDGWMDAWMRG